MHCIANARSDLTTKQMSVGVALAQANVGVIFAKCADLCPLLLGTGSGTDGHGVKEGIAERMLRQQKPRIKRGSNGWLWVEILPLDPCIMRAKKMKYLDGH
jgi:hypothetical protein